MELTEVQKLALLSLLIKTQVKGDGFKVGLKMSEIAMSDAKIHELTEEFGKEKSVELIRTAFTDLTRALYNDIVKKG